jgi:hypothetical protein
MEVLEAPEGHDLDAGQSGASAPGLLAVRQRSRGAPGDSVTR